MFPKLSTSKSSVEAKSNQLIRLNEDDISRRVHLLARQNEVQPSCIFSTAWSLALSTYTGNETVLFALVGTVGPNGTTSLCETLLDPTCTIRSVFRRVQEQVENNVRFSINDALQHEMLQGSNDRPLVNTALVFGGVEKELQTSLDRVCSPLFPMKVFSLTIVTDVRHLLTIRPIK